ncbi:hypothetical protein H4R35_004953 [Dimargaris xerosporica]|nr:hypothetical protein H4R35_004953 [Dimargaris xerosporica]
MDHSSHAPTGGHQRVHGLEPSNASSTSMAAPSLVHRTTSEDAAYKSAGEKLVPVDVATHVAMPGAGEYGDNAPAETAPPTFYTRYRLWIHLVIWLLMTAYFIATLVLHSDRFLIIMLLYIFISGKLFFYHAPVSWLTRPLVWLYEHAVSRPVGLVPRRMRWVLGICIPIICFVLTVVLPPENETAPVCSVSSHC